MQVVAAVVASGVMALLLSRTDKLLVPAGAIGAIALVSFGFRRPALLVLGFIIVRPLLDAATQLTLGVPGANLAGASAMLLIGLAFVMVVRRPASLSAPVPLTFALIVAVTVGSSMLATANFGATVEGKPVAEALRIVSLLAMYVLASNVLAGPDRMRRLTLLTGISGFIPAAWALIELPFLQPVDGYDMVRVSGPFSGPNALGPFLAFTIMILTALPRDWMSMRWRIALIAPQVVALALTYSRVGWFSAIIGVALLEFRRRKHVIIGVTVVLVGVIALVPSVHDRVLPSSSASSSGPTYESSSWRYENWRTLLGLWVDEPIVGYGTATTIFINPRRPALHTEAPDGGFEAHNGVVRILVEGGLVLMLAYVLFLFAVFRTLGKMLRARWQMQPVARMLRIFWVVMLVIAFFTDDPMGYTAVLFILFALMGALEGTYRLERSTATAPAPRVDPDNAPLLYLPARPRTS